MICDKILEAANTKLTDSTQRDKLTELITDLKDLALERHDMVHAMWYALDDGTMQRSRVELDKKSRTLDWSKSTQMVTADVKSLAENMRVCREYLQWLRQTWPEMRALSVQDKPWTSNSPTEHRARQAPLRLLENALQEPRWQLSHAP
jgi:hypothetical protein